MRLRRCFYCSQPVKVDDLHPSVKSTLSDDMIKKFINDALESDSIYSFAHYYCFTYNLGQIKVETIGDERAVILKW